MIIPKFRILFILAVLSYSVIALGQTAEPKLTDQQTHSIADQAIDLFQQAGSISKTDPQKAKELYNQSILRYQKIIDAGNIQNSSLYYNIANAYLMQKDIGHAILNYRRALKFGKPSPDLLGNLHYARTLRLDNIPEQAQDKIKKTLFFWHYDFSTKIKFYIAITGWVSFWILLTISLWRKRKFKLAIIAAGTICLALAISTFIDYQASVNDVHGVIIADTATARKGDGSNYAESFAKPLHAGTEFRLLETRGQWLKVELVSGDITWLKTADAETL
ncbi:MAG: tetratricopeptide repeat protein [Phycisphaerae bacterium]|nr:tetratricopeptide repeat protein [Phycisphaerae bacterium]